MAVSRPLCISWVCAPFGLCELSHPDMFSWLIVSERGGGGAEPRPVSKLRQSIMQPYWFQDCVIYRSVSKEHTCGDLHLGVCLSLCTSDRPRAVFFFKANKPANLQLQHSSVEWWGPLLPCRLQISIQCSCHSMAGLLHLLNHHFYFMDFYHFLSTDVSLWRKIFCNHPRINVNTHTSRVCMFILVAWWVILVTKFQCFRNRS